MLYRSHMQFAAKETNDWIKGLWDKELVPLSVLVAATYPFWFSVLYAQSFSLLRKKNGAYTTTY